MKKLLVVALLSLSTVSMASCTFGLDVKKEGAKTAYAKGGVSVSQKIQDALTAQGCTITKNVMTKEQSKAMTIEGLKKRLAKLETSK